MGEVDAETVEAVCTETVQFGRLRRAAWSTETVQTGRQAVRVRFVPYDVCSSSRML